MANPSYKLHRRDRKGVSQESDTALYVKQGMESNKLNTLSNKFLHRTDVGRSMRSENVFCIGDILLSSRTTTMRVTMRYRKLRGSTQR